MHVVLGYKHAYQDLGLTHDESQVENPIYVFHRAEER